jgi:hypothetical protein
VEGFPFFIVVIFLTLSATVVILSGSKTIL